nr:reverse transcriptase domain-containing protein [Tanacetum cinerariifolium]
MFNSFIVNTGLEEVPLGGSSFTWCHKSATKMSKLDRFFASDNLMISCPYITSVTLDRYLSDHRPILLRESHFDYGPMPFRYFCYWTEMEGFNKFVEDTWNEAPCDCSNAMINMMKKLKYLKMRIIEWNKRNMNNMKNVATKYKEDLEALEVRIDKGEGIAEIVNKIMKVVKNLQSIDVQRGEKQSVDFELKLQHEKENHKWDSTLKNKNTKSLDYSWISKMEKLEHENVSLDFQVQYLIKDYDNVKVEYQKLFDSIKKIRSQTQKEINELIAHVSEKTYAYGAIRVENQNILFTISELKTRLKNVKKDTTYVVLKTRFFEKPTQSKTSDTTSIVSKPKIDVGSASKAKNKVVQIVLWIVDSGCSKHMMGDLSLLRNFIKNFMGTCMCTRTSSNLVGESSPNPTTSNLKCRNCKRSKQPFSLKESPLDTMADQCTMAELFRAPTEVYAAVIVVPPILAEHFELKHSLINMMTSNQFFGLEKDNPHDHIRWFNKITSTIKYKDVPNSKIELILYPFSLAGIARRWLPKKPLVLFSLGKILFPNSSLNSFLPQEGQISETKFLTFNNVLMNRFMRHGTVTKISFKHALIMVLPNCINLILVPLSELEKIKKINEVNIKSMQTQINNVKNELRNEMQTSIQASMSNQTNELKNMIARFIQINTASTSGSGPLPSNTIANPKGKFKAITIQSGLVLDGPFIPMPHPIINPEEDERAKETLTNLELDEDPSYPHILYPLIMNQEKYEIQIHKFWQMFKQLHINITLADALIIILKYQKILKALLSNKEKLLELANTRLIKNCSAVILKKLPEKHRDPGKFLILCGFSELKSKALADLGSCINLMPLSVWKKLGLPELISTRMTLELANQAICTPVGIARDVFVQVEKFTFPADFVIVDYESDPRAPLILGRPFLRTARALIDVHREEMITFTEKK